MHVVDVAVDDWRHHVDHEEDRDGGEDDFHEVTGETNVDHTVSLERAPCVPDAPVVWRGGERCLLLAEAWDVQVDTSTNFWLDLTALDHRHDLPLLFVSMRVIGTDLSQVLVDVVLHIFFLLLIN